MKNFTVILLVIFCTQSAFGQNKKVLDHDAYHIWRNIDDQSISRDGEWVSYVLKSNGEANPVLKLVDGKGNEVLTYERGVDPGITFNSSHMIFKIKPDMWEERELRRIKTKEEDLPKDSLCIFDLTAKTTQKFAGLISVKLPEKWSDWVGYQYDPPNDTTKGKKKSKKSSDKEKSYPLVLMQLSTAETFEFPEVTDYVLAEKGPSIGFVSKGDSTFQEGVYVFDADEKNLIPVFRSKGKYQSLAFDEAGRQFVFVSDPDTTKALVRKWDLNYWNATQDSSRAVVTSDHPDLNDKWRVNEFYENNFSEDGSRLFLGLATYPIVKDTSLLPEEIVNVEVWSYTDPRLHTQQKIEKKEDSEKAYVAVFHIEQDRLVPLSGIEIPEVILGDEGNAPYAVGQNNQPYLKEISWEGGAGNDLYAIDLGTGQSRLIAKNIRGDTRQSPKGDYAYWYSRKDTAWYTYSFAKAGIFKITDNKQVLFYNEKHDSPSYPGPYGVMSWIEDDSKLLIYDRYDIWEVDPENSTAPKKLTSGREQKLRYRYVKLDDEERFIKNGQKLTLTGFYETDKHEAIFEYTYGKSSTPKLLIEGDYAFGDIQKAQNDDKVIFTRGNFKTFPDLQASDLSFKKTIQISNANPQQGEYNWGTIELYKWTSLDGQELEGLLVKPEDFDPGRKYPMIVNFYEKSSDGLNNHRAPAPGRSTITYSFYASRGYVIFNPNVHYKTGYPGESAYNCVIPGVTSLIAEGFIDKDRIGVQGHSWGGYQIAYLVTKTDIFRCAEAGAPVPNMISAYGGIRWWTGLSRMFQYEHTQSRIGGTLWEYPVRYIENSPIFFVDKINTPLLLMHNDADGHVPWYQGIELFVALRRLGKPAWMLNYQGEPHWPQKLQNKIDFNIRLAQYFDHYLKDAPKPLWMERGVPAIEVGIKQGLEYSDSDKHK